MTMKERASNETVEVLRHVLLANGVDTTENQGLHSWRCRYPDRYGTCTCFEDLLAEMTAALSAGQVEQLTEAHDLLGGMYSWNDGFLDAPQNQHLWTVRAARILRALVGRSARDPSRTSPPSDQPAASGTEHKEEEVLANWEGEGGAVWPDPAEQE